MWMWLVVGLVLVYLLIFANQLKLMRVKNHARQRAQRQAF
jgi:hypothetical protein